MGILVITSNTYTLAVALKHLNLSATAVDSLVTWRAYCFLRVY